MWKGRISQEGGSVSKRGGLRVIKLSRFFGEIFSAKQYHPPGVDASPHKSSQPLLDFIRAKLGRGVAMGTPVTGLYLDEVPKTALPGEIKVYSTADGKTVASYLLVARDGTVALNGIDNGGLVEIHKLTEKLNQLVTEVRAHVHASNNTPPTDAATAFNDFDAEDYENEKVTH